jgi:hypothetical protein
MPKLINDEIILQAIDQGLSALGNGPRQALWFFIETDSKISRQKVPENVEEFEQALQKVFGLGYKFLDSLFRNYLSSATGENLSEYPSFATCVKSLRSKDCLSFKK